MALIKQKITLADLIKATAEQLINNPDYFPSDDSLLEQDEYSDYELEAISKERLKLAFAYIFAYVTEISGNGKLRPTRNLSDDEAQHYVGIAFGTAISAALNNPEINYTSIGVDNEDVLQSMDGYTMYIVQNRDDSAKSDDYYLALNHFQDQALSDRDQMQMPISVITYAKYIRDILVKRLVNELLRNYKVV